MERREDVVENLTLADKYMKQMFPSVGKLKLVLIGGAAIILKGFENKTTTDIDTIVKLEDKILNFLRSFAISNDATGVSVLPEGYENRLEKVDLDLEVLEIYVVSNEDLVISKVGRYDYEDRLDLEDTGILDSVDTDKLVGMGEKVSEANKEFKQNWEQFRKLSLFG